MESKVPTLKKNLVEFRNVTFFQEYTRTTLHKLLLKQKITHETLFMCIHDHKHFLAKEKTDLNHVITNICCQPQI